MLIGFAGGRSVFGLRGELARGCSKAERDGASFRYEITTAYLSRYRELLMVHVADHGSTAERERAHATCNWVA